MPKKKNYPKWFLPDWPPYMPARPSKPDPNMYTYEDKEILSLRDYTSFTREHLDLLVNKFAEINEKDSLLCLIHGNHDDGCEARLIYQEKTSCPNPNHEQQLKQYEKDLEGYKKEYEEYKQQKKEWKEWKNKWDEEERQEQENRQKKMYLRLKKKFEND